MAKLIGASAKLITIVPELDEAALTQALAREGLDAEWVRCDGQVRIATILREEAGRTSVLNEPGPSLSVGEWEEFARLVDRRLRRAEVLLCSGSLPPGAPVDGYADLARRARHAGCPCVIDVAGPALAATIVTGEGVVTPNLAEAESLLYGPRSHAVAGEDDTAERAQDAANRLLHQGAFRVVITAGKAGAAYAEQGPRGARGWTPAPHVTTHSPIGAGDAFACGLGLQLEAGAAIGNAVAYAVAVAAAHVESRTGEPDRDRVDQLAAC